MLFFALSQNIAPVSTARHAALNERGKVNFLEKLQDLARGSELRHLPLKLCRLWKRDTFIMYQRPG